MDASLNRAWRLLYVEDNPAEVALVKEALRHCRYPVDLAVAETGAIALDRLRKQGRFASTPTPHLVLLDLNLPGISGDEVLVTIKTDKSLKSLPVVIFSSGASKSLCAPVYMEHANCCIRKPADLDSFVSAVDQICDYWFNLASLPE